MRLQENNSCSINEGPMLVCSELSNFNSSCMENPTRCVAVEGCMRVLQTFWSIFLNTRQSGRRKHIGIPQLSKSFKFAAAVGLCSLKGQSAVY